MKPPYPGAAFDVVALAASAGGLHALTQILGGLPRSFPAALVGVQHLDPKHRSLMPEILGRRTSLLVEEARNGVELQPGTLFMAPPDWHLLVNPDCSLLLVQTELVHFVRPSADLLFESVAACCQDRALGVVLTGTGSDGNMGVKAIKHVGGTVIVEDPGSAEFRGMPEAAIQTGCYDLVLPLSKIAAALRRLVTAPDGATEHE